MKKLILLLVAAFCGMAAASAQDLIVKTDDTRIEAKVTEITPELVRYKRFSNPDGPTYVLPVLELRYIQYANGEKEYFNTSATVPAGEAEQPSATMVPATAQGPEPGPQYVVKTYKVGDFYDHNGVKGVVCVVSDDGQHGLLLSLDELYLPWSLFRKPDLRTVGADDRTNGIVNLEKVSAYIADNNLTWDDFPAFKWCREKGEGWYLPSIDELLTIGHNYNGGSRAIYNRQARNKFNDVLKENGGKRLDRLVYYFSSTEKDERDVLTSHMGIEPPYLIDIPKYNKFIVRAVRRF